MTRKTGWTATTLAALLTACSGPVEAQVEFPGWVGLWDPGMVGWLENENRIGELCSDPMTLSACHAEMLGPKVAVFGLYAGPGIDERRIGDLIATAVPGRGLNAHYRPRGEVAAVPLALDLYMADWGYGIYFHQTFTERRGNWFRLPAEPWEGAVWLHLDLPEPDVYSIRSGDIVEIDSEGWYVVEAEPDALLMRPEQPADMWCQPDDPPPLSAAEPTRWTRQQLLDERGRLRPHPKYMKGC